MADDQQLIGNQVTQAADWLGGVPGQVLHGGLFVVTAAALIAVFVWLLRNRWFQLQPVGRCMVLSVAAHIGLIFLLWGTRIVLPQPPGAAGRQAAPTRFTFQPEPPDLRDHQRRDVQTRPWDRLPEPASQQHSGPDAEVELTALLPSPPRAPTSSNDSAARTEDLRLPSDVDAAPLAASVADPASWLEVQRIHDDRLPMDSPQSAAQAAAIAAPQRQTIVADPRAPAATPAVDLTVAAADVTRPPVRPPTQPPGDLPAPQAVLPTLQAEPIAATEPELLAGLDNPVSSSAAEQPPTPTIPAMVAGSRSPAEPRADSTGSMPPVPIRSAAVRRTLDGQPLPSVYLGRTAANRAAKVEIGGGSDQTERAVALAVHWLLKNQSPDGRWNPRHTGAGQERRILGHDRQGAGARADTGITALALLALMGAGYTHVEGEHRDALAAGLAFLCRSQKPSGELAGDAELFAAMYCHSMALWALAEARAMTGDRTLDEYLHRGVQYSLRSQSSVDGGWRYRPGDLGDMSQFGWKVLALRSAELSGVHIPEANWQAMRWFAGRCSSGPAGGLAAYRPGEAPSPTMTAEALLCRLWMNERLDRAAIEEAGQMIAREMPGSGQDNFYLWYYATLGLYHSEASVWPEWNRQLVRQLLSSQEQAGDQAGSWAPTCLWGGYGGRVYTTALGALCLQVYYRYDLEPSKQHSPPAAATAQDRMQTVSPR